MRVSDCEAIADATKKEDCTGLFIEVTQCRQQAGGQVGGECEKKAIEEYAARSKQDDAGGSQDWSDEDEDAADKDDKGAKGADEDKGDAKGDAKGAGSGAGEGRIGSRRRRQERRCRGELSRPTGARVTPADEARSPPRAPSWRRCGRASG